MGDNCTEGQACLMGLRYLMVFNSALHRWGLTERGLHWPPPVQTRR